ncbi:phage terminase small subunit [Pseudomonas paracarnis]|uniref:phage terminase small subunit n=1 Tax=Pseudomonas paracarnis TaxID=2750625 RepID=UPI0023DF1D5B|nr:phage terminase small subunit [Pseudomonas paracarnis]MDF3188800.1 phage terminase small subunit [Pseudomonas paracarnis]
MALTLAQRNQLRKRAAQEAARTAPAALMDGLTSYELMLAKLQQDQLRLKQVQSQQNKAKVKGELLPEYVPYVDGVLAAGQGAQDDVLVTIMVWRFDAGDYAGGLNIAEYVIRHNLQTPNRFNRTTGCLVAEEVAEAALTAQKAGSVFPHDILTRTAMLTAEQDMPDEARAKLTLALGRSTLVGLDENNPGQPGQIQAGIDLLKAAIQQHNSCGGKKDLERAERLLKKHAGPAS